MTHIANRNTMKVEWYTPPTYIEAVKRVFKGEIDLDLASSAKANEIIKAKKYYTSLHQSQNIDWCENSKIFLNPPYDKQIEAFSERYVNSKLKEAIVLVNSSTETKWYRNFLNGSVMLAFPDHRIRFFDATKNEYVRNNNKAQTFFYRGENISDFAREFKKLGCSICSIMFNKVLK